MVSVGQEMNPRAIAEAEIRLERARAAVETMESVEKWQTAEWDFKTLETGWWTFLHAASGIYAKLEQGAKTNGRSSAWFGRVKRLRKTDPLLSYLHHARNSEQHGLDPILEHQKLGFVAKKGATVVPPAEEGGQWHIQATVGVPMEVQIVSPDLFLMPVVDDRFGDEFDPPTEHLGNPLIDISPWVVARLGLDYLVSLIEDAKALPQT